MFPVKFSQFDHFFLRFECCSAMCCQNMSEYVRMVPFFPASICIFLRSSPLICLKSCLSRSLLGAAYQKAWSSRDVLFLGFLQILLMISQDAYVILLRLILSHCTLYILSSRFMMLKNVFCLILSFFFWQVEVKELGGTSLCSTRPRVHSSCNRCYWSQGAGQNGQIQKIQKKDEKGLLLFVHVCCNVEDWYKLYKLFESRNSGIGEKFRQRNYSNSYAGPRRWLKLQIADLGQCWTMLDQYLQCNSCFGFTIRHSPPFTPDQSGGLQVYLVWFSLVSTWRRRNRGIPWMPLGLAQPCAAYVTSKRFHTEAVMGFRETNLREKYRKVQRT